MTKISSSNIEYHYVGSKLVDKVYSGDNVIFSALAKNTTITTTTTTSTTQSP